MHMREHLRLICVVLLVVLTVTGIAAALQSQQEFHILYVSDVSGNYGIYYVGSDQQSPQPIQVPPFPQDDITDAACSPDGTKVALNPFAIALLDLGTGELTQLPLEQYSVGPLTWSPDGSRIAFVEGRPGDIFILDLDTMETTQITTEGDNLFPVWSRDGQHLVYSTYYNSTASIVMRSLDTDQVQTVLSGAAYGYYSLQWTPFDRQIAYDMYDPNSGIYIYDLETGVSSPFLTSEEHSYGRSLWSPDGQRVAFTSTVDGPQELYVSSNDGTGRQRLTFDGAAWDGAACWLPAMPAMLNNATITSAATPGLVSGPRFAPYFRAQKSAQYSLAQTARELGFSAVVMAFVTGRAGDSEMGESCAAIWDAFGPPVSLDAYIPDFAYELASLRRAGIDIIVSFGGAAGDDLAMICDSAESLAQEMQEVISRYDLTRVDFDIEGPALNDQQSIDRRSQAIAMIQAAAQAEGRKLDVQFTLPALSDGLSSEGLAVLQSARSYGVEIALVNIKVMNFGEPSADNSTSANAISAAESLHAQMQVLYPDREEAELWAMIGMTPMIGMNNVRTEVPMVGLNGVHPELFTLSDAASVREFAESHGLGQLSMWSVTRDQACDDPSIRINPSCSGIQQAPLAFARALQGQR